MWLISASVVMSLIIAGFGLFQARRLFGAYNASIRQMAELARGFATCLDGASLKACVEGIPEDDGVLRSIAFRLNRALNKPALNLGTTAGWLVDLDDLCDAKRLYKIHPSFERVQSMPGLLTGVGILFTFVGLTMGVFGLDPTDAERLTQGIQRLLGGMSLAFLTSIAGIATALIWTWTSKTVNGRFEAAVSDLYKALAQKPFLILPEESREGVLTQLFFQSRALQNLEPVMVSAFRRGFEESGLKQLLQQTAPTDNADLAETLTGIRESLSHVASGISQIAEGNQKIGELAAKLIRAQQTVTDQVGASLEREQTMAQNAAKIQVAQNLSIEELNRCVEAIQATSENLRAASGDMTQHFRTTTELVRQLDASWKRYRDQVQTMLGTLETGLKGFRTHLSDAVGEVHGEIDRLMADSLGRFASAIKGMDNTLETLTALMAEEPEEGSRKSSWLGFKK